LYRWDCFDITMVGMNFTRDQAWDILCEFTQSDALRKHGLAVEACLVAYARKFNEDENLWSITGLIHDFDWEVHPQVPDHPLKGSEILASRGVPQVIRTAIISHVPDCHGLRQTRLEKTLFACDELAGFLTAYAYVKPSRSIHDVDAKGVRKKMKDKAFARAVNRDDIINGAAAMNVDLDEHIDFCIKAMQARAGELGLQGS
jgi:predicted hydrolase (HD superfamily)